MNTRKLSLQYSLLLSGLIAFNSAPLRGTDGVWKTIFIIAPLVYIYYYKTPLLFASKTDDPVRAKDETLVEKSFRKNDNAVYLYAPGFLANATQAGKYTRKFVCKETNETITSDNGMQVLGNNVYVVKGNEVESKIKNLSFLENPFKWAWNNICYTFAGRANNSYGVSIKQNEGTSSISGQSINPLKLRIGLNEDKESVISTFKTMVSENKDKDIVIYAVSRGTAAVNNALPELAQLEGFENIKGIVLEGAFDSMEHVYNARFPIVSKILPFTIANRFCRWATGADQKDNNPCENLKQTLLEYGKKVPPIMMVSSKIDKDVPYECTKNLYENTKELGTIELITLEIASSKLYV